MCKYMNRRGCGDGGGSGRRTGAGLAGEPGVEREPGGRPTSSGNLAV